MTAQQPDTDDVDPAGEFEDIGYEVQEAIEALNRGPAPGDISTNLGDAEAAADEIIRQAESVRDAVGNLTTNRYGDSIDDMEAGVEDAIDILQMITDRAGSLSEALADASEDADDIQQGKITLDGTVYAVTFERLGPAVPDTFAEWLERRMADHDVTVAELERETPEGVTETAIVNYIEGERAPDDTSSGLVRYFRNAGYITDREMDAVRRMVEDAPETDDDGGSDGEGLGNLFG